MTKFIASQQMKSGPIDRREFVTLGAVTGIVITSPNASASQAAEPMSGVIDCQSHVFFPAMVDLMRRRKQDPVVYDERGTTYLKMGDWLRKIPPSYTDVNSKLQAMDASGIALTMLSSNDPGPEWFGLDGPAVAQLLNDSVAEVVAKHPTRFLGLCVLPLQDENSSSKELDRCHQKLRMKGILLYTNLAGHWCDEPKYHWLYARAEELGMPVLLHPAKPMTTEFVKGYELTSTLGNMFENTIALARIIASGLLDRFPRLKLVCPHLGGTLPYISGRMDHQLTVLKRGAQNLQRKPSDYLRDIYMDIVSPLPEAMRFAVDFSGPNRLLFSSDHPWVHPTLVLETLRSIKLRAEDEKRILFANARELFDL